MVNELVSPRVAEDTMLLRLQAEQHREPHTHRHIPQPRRLARRKDIIHLGRDGGGINMVHHEGSYLRVVEISQIVLSLTVCLHL